MSEKFDVLIVGARCAGASLGTFLSRHGVRTLLVDAAPLGTDMTMSTHFIQPPGMDVLDELGLGTDVRRLAPASRRLALRADDHQVVTRYPEGRAGYCLRRFELDALLQNAAAAAGADVRGNTKLVELVRDGDRVTGAVLQTAKGRETVHTDLVVGADGRHRKVSELTGVEEYLSFDMTRGGYWMYWPKPRVWDDDPRFDFDSLIDYEGDGMRYVFQTDGDLLLLVAAPPSAEASSWGRDYRSRYIDYMKASPHTAPLVEGNAPVGKAVGLLKARFFYRRPIGKGFALVGDAGEFKDFVTGHGITDALLDARSLAAAILDARPGAFEWYWRHRDAMSVGLYLDAQRLGAVGANDAFMRFLVAKASRSTDLANRFGEIPDRTRSPVDALQPKELVSWLLEAVLRGRLDVVRAFFKAGPRMGAMRSEIERRAALLAEVEQRLGRAPSLDAARLAEPERVVA